MTLSICYKRSRPLYLPGETVEGEIILRGNEEGKDGKVVEHQAVVATLIGVASCGFWKPSTDKASGSPRNVLQKGKTTFLYQSMTLRGSLFETGPRSLFRGQHQVVYFSDDENDARFRKEKYCQGMGDMLLSRETLKEHKGWRIQVFLEQSTPAASLGQTSREILTRGRCVGEATLDQSQFQVDTTQTFEVSTTPLASGEEQISSIQAKSVTVSVHATEQCGTSDVGEPTESDSKLVFRIHVVDFVDPSQAQGQVYVRLLPVDQESNGFVEVPSIDVSSSPLSFSKPLKIPFSLGLPRGIPASLRWADGKKHNASVRYYLGAHVKTGDHSTDLAIQEPIYVLPELTVPRSMDPISAKANKQALTYTSWNHVTKETGETDLKLCLPQEWLVPGQQVNLSGTSVTNRTAKTLDVSIRLNQHTLLVALEGNIVMNHGWNGKHPLTTTGLLQAFRARCPPHETWTMPPDVLLRIPRIPSTLENTAADWPVQIKYTCQLSVTTEGGESVASTEVPVHIVPFTESEESSSQEVSEEVKAASCPSLAVFDSESTSIMWKAQYGDSCFQFIPGDGSLACCST